MTLVTHTPLIAKTTGDGSITCFNEQVQEHYHNIHGALTEARAFYIAPSRFTDRYQWQTHLTLLDPFFGLGFNTLAAIDHVWQLKQQGHIRSDATLSVIAMESDPHILAMRDETQQHFHPEPMTMVNTGFAHNASYRTHDGALRFLQEAPIEGFLRFRLVTGDARQLVQYIQDIAIDLIYHDAFSAKVQPELWTQQLFEQYYRLCQPAEGAVLTYGGAASVRKGLANAGFVVGSLVSHVGKVGTYATCNHWDNCYTPLSELEAALMESKSGLPLIDNTQLTASPQSILATRQQRMTGSLLQSSSSVHKRFKQHQEGSRWEQRLNVAPEQGTRS
ncbi:MAG: hypothetical protein KC474_06285 [Cyanobacteria bacterium HKST-UBA04]|nr:hypothetical protein [Cyanobacteria bacterium HKST-UBA04]